MAEVVLVSLYNHEDLGLRTLHAVLENYGVEVQTLFFKEREGDNTFEPYDISEIDHLVSEIGKRNPKLVGIGVMSAFVELSEEVTKRIKTLPNSPIVVWGGIHPTLKPLECAKIADIACIGEGEGPIIDILECIRSKQEITKIPNLCVGNIKNDLRPLEQDLDSIPFPSCSSDGKWVVNKGKVYPYDYNHVIKKQGFRFLTNLGCPFKCSFCANSILRDKFKGKGKYTRARSVPVIIDELKRLDKEYDLGDGMILFQDEIFAPTLKWAIEFAESYQKNIGKPFWCYGHPGTIREEIVAVLKTGGLQYMQVGIQSGSERIRDDYLARHHSNEKVLQGAQVLSKLGVSWGIDLLMENPLETDEDRQATLELLLVFPKPFEVNTHTLTHFPEYPLSNQLLELGAISEDDLEDIRSESFKHNRWNPRLDPTRDKTNMFWSSLFHLASIPGLDPQDIRNFMNNENLRNNPEIMRKALETYDSQRKRSKLIETIKKVPFKGVSKQNTSKRRKLRVL